MARIWNKWLPRGSKRRVSFWYHPRYEAPSLAKIAHSLGMIALRGKRILAQLADEGLVKPRQLKPFPLLSIKDLALFHSPEYLERAGRRDTLARIFGSPEFEIKIDEVLSAERWAVSGTWMAAQSALRGPAPLAFNLGGGFHHAEPGQGSGFCVFNDVGVAIRKLRQEGFERDIVIVDLDFHQGNGNIVGFLDDPSVHNYSVHGAIWTEKEGAGHFNLNMEGPILDQDYLGALKSTLPDFIDRFDPGLVFFIAGHDVLEPDPLGQFSLSLDGVGRRDRLILDILAERSIPGVITLGGGYSLQACQAALNLALAAMGNPGPLSFDAQAEQSSKFRKLLHSIDPQDPDSRPGDPFKLSEADFWPDLDGLRSPSGTLTSHSAYEVEREMESCGFLEKLRRRGLEDFRISLDPEAGEKYRVRVEARHRDKRDASLQTVAELSYPPLEKGSWADLAELRE